MYNEGCLPPYIHYTCKVTNQLYNVTRLCFILLSTFNVLFSLKTLYSINESYLCVNLLSLFYTIFMIQKHHSKIIEITISNLDTIVEVLYTYKKQD